MQRTDARLQCAGATARDQPAGTYKFLFNGLYYGNARAASLP